MAAEKKEDKLLIVVSYVIWVIGLALYALKKDENGKFANFHYLQATALGVVGFILSFVTFGLGSLLLWLYSVYLGYKVFNGEDPRPLKKYLEKYI